MTDEFQPAAIYIGDNSELHGMVQEVLFDLGHKWSIDGRIVKNTHTTNLVLTNKGRIRTSFNSISLEYFESHLTDILSIKGEYKGIFMINLEEMYNEQS